VRCGPSDKTPDELDARRLEIRRNRRIRVNSGAKSFDHIPDMLGKPSLDLDANSLCHNGSILVEHALAPGEGAAQVMNGRIPPDPTFMLAPLVGVKIDQDQPLRQLDRNPRRISAVFQCEARVFQYEGRDSQCEARDSQCEGREISVDFGKY